MGAFERSRQTSHSGQTNPRLRRIDNSICASAKAVTNTSDPCPFPCPRPASSACDSLGPRIGAPSAPTQCSLPNRNSIAASNVKRANKSCASNPTPVSACCVWYARILETTASACRAKMSKWLIRSRTKNGRVIVRWNFHISPSELKTPKPRVEEASSINSAPISKLVRLSCSLFHF